MVRTEYTIAACETRDERVGAERLPVRRLTAPKQTMDLRLGACNRALPSDSTAGETSLTFRPRLRGGQMAKKRYLLPVLAAVLSIATAFSQEDSSGVQTPAEVLRNIQHSSNDIEQLRAGLTSPDPSVRVATFSAMMQSNNPSLTALAINEGHASADASLRDLAARAAFAQTLGLIIEPSFDIAPEMQKNFMYFSSVYALRVKIAKYDWRAGLFMIAGGGEGQISGTRLTFRDAQCQGSLAAVEGSWTYEGNVVCASGRTNLAGRMHVTIR